MVWKERFRGIIERASSFDFRGRVIIIVIGSIFFGG